MPANFTALNGDSNWSYYHHDANYYQPMRWSVDHWQGSSNWTRAYSNAVHPDANQQVALAWKAPNSGTVVISGNVKKADTSGGDGVVVSIFKKDTANMLWGRHIPYNDGIGTNFNITTTPP